MRTIALTAALITATVSTAAIAADWVVVAESDSGDVVTIDSTSIRTMPSGNKRAWVMHFFPKPPTTSKDADRAVVLREYDCREEKSRGLQHAFYKDEKALGMDTVPSAWSYASPGSLHEAEVNYVCFGRLDE